MKTQSMIKLLGARRRELIRASHFAPIRPDAAGDATHRSSRRPMSHLSELSIHAPLAGWGRVMDGLEP